MSDNLSATISGAGTYDSTRHPRVRGDGDYIYFVTVNVQDRRWFFVTPERATVVGQTIQTCCKLKNFELLAYCILPNHLHLLVRKKTVEEIQAKLKFHNVRSSRHLHQM